MRIPECAGVAFTNAGRNIHNVVPVDPARWPAVDTSAVQPSGKLALPFERADVYKYYCTYHGTADGRGVAGAIVVGDAEYTGGAALQLLAVEEASGTVRRVPEQDATIERAVDAAAPGDLILIAAGVYREEVTLTTPSLVIRGLDRNETIIDGEYIRPKGFNVLADGVALENLTARLATLNGLFWTGVTGYRGRYLAAVNNGDYGIYAFDSVDGLLEDSYASGSADAGFCIVQCYPSNALIRRVVSEHNAVGYSGANAGGNLHIINSVWHYNRGGLVPNTLDTELFPPQRRTTIRHNLIHDNNSRSAPGRELSPLAWRNGIVLGGGRNNVIERNVIVNHAGPSVMIAPLSMRTSGRRAAIASGPTGLPGAGVRMFSSVDHRAARTAWHRMRTRRSWHRHRLSARVRCRADYGTTSRPRSRSSCASSGCAVSSIPTGARSPYRRRRRQCRTPRPRLQSPF